MNFNSIGQLAEAVEAWCVQQGVQPANGQVATRLTERTLRYYRTLGLLDGPTEGGFGERHFLQLAALKLLQTQGLPLRRIQTLLQGRDDDSLREIRQRGLREWAPAPALRPAQLGPEAWFMIPLDAEWLLVSRRGRSLEAGQIEAIREVLSVNQPYAGSGSRTPLHADACAPTSVARTQSPDHGGDTLPNH